MEPEPLAIESFNYKIFECVKLSDISKVLYININTLLGILTLKNISYEIINNEVIILKDSLIDLAEGSNNISVTYNEKHIYNNYHLRIQINSSVTNDNSVTNNYYLNSDIKKENNHNFANLYRISYVSDYSNKDQDITNFVKHYKLVMFSSDNNYYCTKKSIHETFIIANKCLLKEFKLCCNYDASKETKSKLNRCRVLYNLDNIVESYKQNLIVSK